MSEQDKTIMGDIDPLLDTGRAAREAVRLMLEERERVRQIAVDVADIRRRAEAWDQRYAENRSIWKKVLAYALGLLKAE